MRENILLTDFKSQMTFPKDFPFSPPSFRFTPAIFHPNVYKDGRLCISILHRSGDATSGEPDNETWVPTQTVETVLISIVSLLADPNVASPANIDAAILYTKAREEFNARVRQEVERSKLNIPPGFVMPTEISAYVAPKPIDAKEEVYDENFWYESEDSMDDFEEGDDDENSQESSSEEDGEVDKQLKLHDYTVLTP